MTNAEARFNKSLRPRKPEGSLGRTAQDVHLDSHTAPELCAILCSFSYLYQSEHTSNKSGRCGKCNNVSSLLKSEPLRLRAEEFKIEARRYI